MIANKVRQRIKEMYPHKLPNDILRNKFGISSNHLLHFLRGGNPQINTFLKYVELAGMELLLREKRSEEEDFTTKTE